MSFEDFLFLALSAILFNEVEPLRPSWISDRHDFNSFDPEIILLLQSKFGSKRPNVWEEMSKIDFQDGGCGGHLGFSISSFSYFVSTRRLMLIIKFQFNWFIEEISKI